MIEIVNNTVCEVKSIGNISHYSSEGRKCEYAHKVIGTIVKAYDKYGKVITDEKEIKKHFNCYHDPIEILPFYRKHGVIWNFFDKWARPIKDWYMEKKLQRLGKKINAN